MSNNEKKPEIRLDKWLWACRFYKTRALARQAIEGGKVSMEGFTAKPSKNLIIGMKIRLRIGFDTREILVKALSDKRGSASFAQTLYEETEESCQLREKSATDRKLLSRIIQHDKAKPDKHKRRESQSFKRQS